MYNICILPTLSTLVCACVYYDFCNSPSGFLDANFLNEPSVFAVDLILKRRFGSPLMFGHKTHSVA